MGILNLIKANFTGRVGQMVGAKWKNKSTIRSYTKPAYTSTPAQQVIRQGFGEITSFVALFADQIRSLSALDTKGMSVRNAIIKLNRDMVQAGTLDHPNLLVSRGGLPMVSSFVATQAGAGNVLSATWSAATGATISERARVVVIAVDPDNSLVRVGTALNSAGTITLDGANPAGASWHIYHYLLDWRGSSRVASPSAYSTI